MAGYLAYADLSGIHIKLIETGETRTVPQPETLKGAQVNWGIATNWVRDGSMLYCDCQCFRKGPECLGSTGHGGFASQVARRMLTPGLSHATDLGWHSTRTPAESSIGKCGK